MSGQPEASPEARVRAAAALTAQAGTAWLVTAMCPRSVPDPEDVTGAGFADLSQRRSMLVASLVSLRTAKRLGLERGGRFARGLLAVLRGPADVAYVAGRRYFRVADGPWREPEGKQVGLLDLNDPLWWLGMPGAAAQDVVELGEEDVHGVSATRYRLTIDLAVVTGDERGLEQSIGWRLRTLFLREQTVWRRHLPAEVWLDDDGRVRRVSSLAIPPEVAGPTRLWTITELTDFGTAVRWEGPAPPSWR
jgi:hypothetical protein